MWEYQYYPPSTELYHHGILGMHWGKRNGPPYPLSGSAHSPSEKKAGWRKSLKLEKKQNAAQAKVDKRTDSPITDNQKHRLSDKQKTFIKIGMVAAGAAILAIGVHKLGYDKRLLNLIKQGRSNKTAQDLLSGSLPDSLDPASYLTSKKLKQKESFLETLTNTNPLHNTTEGINNCSSCALAGHLRLAGYDAKGKSLGGKPQNLIGVVDECFSDAKVLDGSAVKFGKSPTDAAEMLVKRFGDNASGACSISWRNEPTGHIFNWFIEDGNVKFVDFQQRRDSINKYWDYIDLNGPLQLVRLDNATVKDLEALKKYVDI